MVMSNFPFIIGYKKFLHWQPVGQKAAWAAKTPLGQQTRDVLSTKKSAVGKTLRRTWRC